MAILDPDLRRTWIFGPGADSVAQDAMLNSGADALIVNLEDFTPLQRRGEARELLGRFVQDCRNRQRVATIRINALQADGMIDLCPTCGDHSLGRCTWYRRKQHRNPARV
jgi:citrate lyase beta subunit